MLRAKKYLHYLCCMYEYDDHELGKIIVKPDTRAKNIIARRKMEYIQLTVPLGFDRKRLPAILDEMRPRLLNTKTPLNLSITEESIVETFSFTAKLSRTNLIENGVRIKLKNKELTVFIPSYFDLKLPDNQHIVKEMIRYALRHESKRILRQKTMLFAKKFNLQVTNVKINKSVSRWGSCSQKKSINFSLYLLLLPERYIDYVVLHELAHTMEMNHSDNFWKLLSQFCGEDAKVIDRELRNYKSIAYELLKP